MNITKVTNKKTRKEFTETAKIIYKKLAASYGSSPEAATAKKRMSSL